MVDVMAIPQRQEASIWAGGPEYVDNFPPEHARGAILFELCTAAQNAERYIGGRCCH